MRHALAGLAAGLAISSGLLPATAGNVSGGGDAIGIMAAGPESLGAVQRLSTIVDHENGLRLVPMLGKGPVQTLTDVIYLKGVDAAVMTADAVDFAEANGLIEGAAGKVAYIAKLANLDINLVSRRGIDEIADLAGKRVAIGTTANPSFVAAQTIFAAAGIAFEPVNRDGAEALKAVAAGEADAALLVGLRPLPALAAVSTDAGLHLIGIEADERLAKTYLPSLVTSADYPGLVDKARPVETLSVAQVIAVYDWARGSPRYERLARFSDAVFAALDRAPASGSGFNTAASVPGWKRFAAADDWLLARRRESPLATTLTSQKEN